MRFALYAAYSLAIVYLIAGFMTSGMSLFLIANVWLAAALIIGVMK